MTDSLATTWDIDDGSQQSLCNSGVLGEQNVQSLKSFWSGVAGLGLIAVCSGIAVVVGERGFEEVLMKIMLRELDAYNTLANGMVFQRSFDAQDFLRNSLAALVGGCAWLAILPVLLWRGNLIRRFTIATLLFTCVCFLFDFVGDLYFHEINSNWMKLQNAICVALCWGSLPLLVRLKALQNSRLFFDFVCYSVIILAACAAIASMDQPSPSWIVAFICAYAFVFFAASLMRKLHLGTLWEAQSWQQKTNSRLSTASLIALTGIVAVFVTALLMWTRSLMNYEMSPTVHSIVFLVLMCAICISHVLIVFEIVKLRRGFRGIYWLWMITLVTLTMHVGMGQNFRTKIRFNFSLEHYVFELAVGVTVTFFLVLVTKSCKAWLKYCGWSVCNGNVGIPANTPETASNKLP